MHHVTKSGPQRRRTVALAAPTPTPRVLTASQTQAILDACTRLRDRFLFAVLLDTGVRIEELLEITHHSLVQYHLPSTGELVPLLQIAPSKTDSERLLVVSPELADVLSTIIRRVRGTTAAIPVIPAYDRTECVWLAPAPWLFQRRLGTEHRRICSGAIRNALNTALADSTLTDPETGGPLIFTPHDFRRILSA